MLVVMDVGLIRNLGYPVFGYHNCMGKMGAGPPTKNCMHYDHDAIRTTPTRMLKMLLDLPQFGIMVEAADLAAAYRLPKPNPKGP